MKKNISQIPNVLYGYIKDGVEYLQEPSREDIQIAINNSQLEERGFQSHIKELRAEWHAIGKSDREVDCLVRIYHSRRIAFFVVKGWTKPIELAADGRIHDGLHRLKAAMFMGMDEVEITVQK